ncbi:MAG: sulfatase-like hydrolase/transferase [Planctomycetota bacterium]
MIPSKIVLPCFATCVLASVGNAVLAQSGGQARQRPGGLVVPDVPREEVICFALYTVDSNVLKLTAQLYPLRDDEPRDVRLQVDRGDGWKTVATTEVIEDGWTAPFRVAGWDDTVDARYRVAHGEAAFYAGRIRRNPVDKNEIVVAGFTGNSINKRHGGDIPRTDIIRNIERIDPDVLFFAGDQVYDHTRHYAAWLKFGRDFGAIIRDRPTITIPDDHDAGQANLWGEAGGKSHRNSGDDGGYFRAPAYVRMVERAQTSHLPDAYDPAPVQRGIGVYFTDYTWGGVSFAILEDRKFKSGPGGLVPQQGPRPDHILDPDYDPESVDVPGAVLLGERQLAFLDDWGRNWSGADMKVALSQTIFCGGAHIHGKVGGRLHADLDSNGWPQTGRNKAVDALRKCYAFHIAGDQHLATIFHHGVDEHRDAMYSFCVPSIANLYLRWWEPLEPGGNREPGMHEGLGDHLDGFGNRVTCWAVANPKPGGSGGLLTTRAAGFGVVRLDKRDRTITMECWPRNVDVTAPDARQYPGWPKTIAQADNYGRAAQGYLPTLRVDGAEDPLVTIIDESSGEWVYALRINGTVFRPKVFRAGTYTIKVGEGDRQQVYRGIASGPLDDGRTLEVRHASDRAQATKPLKIYLLAGQSNMVGSTSAEWVEDNAPALAAARDDVWCYWNGATRALAPGAGHAVGPELAFGHAIGDVTEQPVLLAKFAVGGTTLHRDWRPPSAVARSGGEIGHLYKTMMKQLHRILADPAAYCPGYEGVDFELGGFLWLQGENDCFDGMEAFYEDNFRDLIADVRAGVGTPDLPFGVMVINDSGAWDDAGGGGPDVRAAQRAVAANDPLGVSVETADLDPGYHYADGDHVVIGRRIGEAMLPFAPRRFVTDAAALDAARGRQNRLFYPGRGPRPPRPDVHVSDLKWVSAAAGYGGDPRRDASIEDRPLSVAGERFPKGIGTHAESSIVCRIQPEYARFVAIAGIDDEMAGRGVCSVVFRVLIDGAVAAESVVMKAMERWHFDVVIPAGARELRLDVLEAESGINSDHADWVDAGFILGDRSAHEAGAHGERPNIIYIMLDDAGYGDFGCYGQERFATPNIDRLASEGMRFTQHYAGSTVCAPSRCALMTGMHTGHCAVRGNKRVNPLGQWPIPDETVTVAELLQGAGYVTGAFGKWGLGPPDSEGGPTRQGFDRFYGYNCQRNAHTYYPTWLYDDEERVALDGETYAPDLIVEQALAFIRENQGGPFFCYLPFTTPHAAMHVPDAWSEPFRKAFPQFEDTIGRYAGTETVNPIAAFAGMMTKVDDDIGHVLALLEELGLDDNTIVLFTSDNGPHQEGGHDPRFFDSNGPLTGLKRSLTEGGIRVPLIARWRGRIAAGSESHLLCAQWDFLPTACELAHVTAPGDVDGLSIVPTLLGTGVQPEHEYLYWEFYERGGKRAVRMGRWKAIQRNLHKTAAAPIVLHDLASDLAEAHDVAAEHPEIVAQARTIFERAHARSEHWSFKGLAENDPAGRIDRRTPAARR